MSDVRHCAEKLEHLLPLLLRSIFRLEESDPLGELPVAQLRMLRAVGSKPSTVGELAEDLGVSISAVSQILHRLAEIDYVQIVADDADRRQRHVRLTPLSQRLMEARRQARIENAELAISALSPEDRTALVEHLARLLGACRKQSLISNETLLMTADIERPLPVNSE